MKRIVLILILLSGVAPFQYWFELGANGEEVRSAALGGANEQYIIHGRYNNFKVYTMNWADGSYTSSDIQVGVGNTNIDGFTAIQTDRTKTVVVATKTMFKFTIEPGVVNNGFAEYTLPTGKHYAYPFWFVGTSYMFFGTRDYGSADRKAYRILTTTLEVKSFDTGHNSKGFGILYGTSWFLVSLDGSDKRKLFDHTVGDPGGTNNPITYHNKPNSNKEIGFFSPEDNRGVYVISAEGSGSSLNSLITVNYDGTERFARVLNVHGWIHRGRWLKDSDLCVVSSWGNQFAIVNFMDQNQSPQLVSIQNSGANTLQPVVSHHYKIFIIVSDSTDRSFVYKAEEEMPCSSSCVTCQGIFRGGCLTCVDNATKKGESCVCNLGFFEKKISETKTKCEVCSTLCATCSGGSAQQCLTCKYPAMEKKADGSCGCPEKTYQIGETCSGQCHSSCLTCSGPGESECLSCSTREYISGGRCLPCDQSCKTCSGSSSNNCLSCDISKSLSSGSCFACDPFCKSCLVDNAGGTTCIQCLHAGILMKSTKCHSCAVEDLPECSSPTKITPPGTLQELHQNLTISFSPALQDPLLPNFKITAKDLVEKHLKINYKRKEQASQPLTILEKTLTHTETGSQLLVTFLEKMRISNTEHIEMIIEDPWLYYTDSSQKNTQNQQNVVYLKTESFKILITKGDKEDPFGEGEPASVLTHTSRVVVATAVVGSVGLAAASGLNGSMMRALKFFNILEILSNLAKINVKFSSKITSIIDFINGLTFPELTFLFRFSPLKDTLLDDPDVNKYLLIKRGSRGKIAESNGDIFIVSGQNFVISLLVLVLWVSFKLLGWCTKQKGGRAMKCLVFAYQVIFGLMFFDYQMICMTEVAFFDYSNLGKHSFVPVLSLVMSYCVVLLVAREYYKGIELLGRISRKSPKKNKSKTKIGEKEKEKKAEEKGDQEGEMAYSDQLILDKYTDSLKPPSNGQNSFYVLVETVRFFMIQVVIISLQLLNRAQALLMLFIDIGFFIYFMKEIWKRELFDSKFLMIKTIIQEVCILLIITTMTIFGFTEETNFSSSFVYKALEMITIFSIIIASFSELVVMASGFYQDSMALYKKSKNNLVSQKKGISTDNKLNESQDAQDQLGGVERIDVQNIPPNDNEDLSINPARSRVSALDDSIRSGDIRLNQDDESQAKAIGLSQGVNRGGPRKFIKPPTNTKMRSIRMGYRGNDQGGTKRADSGLKK